MTEEMQEQLKSWQEDVMCVSKQITSATSEYEAACEARLEKKRVLEELESTLKELCDRGPFGNSESESLLASADDTGSSIRTLKMPGRIYTILEKAGVTTLARLEQIIDGFDDEFDDLNAISGMDADTKNRIESELKDSQTATNTVATIPTSAPALLGIPGQPALQVDVVQIKTNASGAVFEATILPTGQAVVQEDGDIVIFEQDEYQLLV
jgi:chromosome segregation ATPase